MYSWDRSRCLTCPFPFHASLKYYQYASTHAPITSFRIPPLFVPPPLPHTPALPLAALPCSRLALIKDYFGLKIPITPPLLTPAALLICAVRLEVAGTETLDLLDTPDQHHQPMTQLAEWGPGRGSEQYEHDWMRLITCYSAWYQPLIRRRVFTPGMLTGNWIGRVFVRCYYLECIPTALIIFVGDSSEAV